MSKYELTISTGYVPSWTYVEAVRELFQNAIDNERINPDNKMLFEYKMGKLSICNKTSKLTLDSLLIGNSTKRDDERTIGEHGEGYKIAIMILLREGKNVTVYNYGANEIWTTKLVKSRRFNGAQVVQIDVNKTPFWSKVPNYDLTIEVEGITDSEYTNIVDSNLNLKEKLNTDDSSMYGELLLDEAEKGRVYVEGLYVCTQDYLKYGYNFKSRFVRLDRDRKLVDSFNICWYSSSIWASIAASNSDKYADICVDMINTNAKDVEYIDKSSIWESGLKVIAEKLYNNLVNEHGEDIIPVSSNDEYDEVHGIGMHPIIVSEKIKNIVKTHAPKDIVRGVVINKKDRLLFKIKGLQEKLGDKCSYEEKEEFSDIIRYIEEEF